MVHDGEGTQSFFLPSLDKCLSGRHRLISWKSAFEALSNYESSLDNRTIEAFLLDELSISTLGRRFEPFGAPTAQSKADYESRTASINVAAPANEEYNVEQIKKDSTWLSKEVGIDEVSALRITILHWQVQPAARLLSGLTESERISVHQATSTSENPDWNLAQWYRFSETGLRRDADSSTAKDADGRRRRELLHLLLSEHTHAIGVRLLLDSINAAKVGPGAWDEDGGESGSIGWVKQVLDKLEDYDRRQAKISSSSDDNCLATSVEALDKRLRNLEEGCQWTVPEEEATVFDEVYRDAQMAEVVRILQMACLDTSRLAGKIPPPSIVAWFEFVDRFGFFQNFQPPYPTQELLVAPCQALVSIITLQALSLEHTMKLLHQPDLSSTPVPPVLDGSCPKVINATISNAVDHFCAIASPAIFAWSMIMESVRGIVQASSGETFSDDDGSPVDGRSPTLQRRRLSTTPSRRAYVDAFEALNILSYDDPPLHWAQMAVDALGVFSIITDLAYTTSTVLRLGWLCSMEFSARSSLLDLIRHAIPVANYGSEILNSTVATLNGQPRTSNSLPPSNAALVEKMLADERMFKPHFLLLAQSRYPHETGPFLKLSRTLAAERPYQSSHQKIVLPILDSAAYFTAELPSEYDSSYQLIREEDNANLVELTDDLLLFRPTQRKLTSGRRGAQPDSTALVLRDGEAARYVPRGATGLPLNDSKPMIVTWQHNHCPLSYFAQALSTVPLGASNIPMLESLSLEREDIADVIELFAQHFKVDPTKPTAEQKTFARDLASKVSVGLDRNLDIIAVVFEIFEEELSRFLQQRGESTAILSSCVNFIHTVHQFEPSRTWPFLARCKLVEVDGQSGKIASIIAAIEIVSGHYDLLEACLRLYEELVVDAIRQVALKPAPKRNQSTRFGEDAHTFSGLPQKTMSQIILGFTRFFVDFLQSSSGWHFNDQQQHIRLLKGTVDLFKDLLTFVYDYNDTPSLDSKITAALVPASKYLLDVFLDPSTATPMIKRLLSICTAEITIPWSAVNLSITSSWGSLTRSVMDFISKLLYFSVQTDTPCASLQEHLLHAMPFLIRLVAVRDTHRRPIIRLLTELTRNAAKNEGEPPSLLGYVDSSSATDFLSVLRTISDNASSDSHLSIDIWRLLKTIVSSQQRWLSTVLLTGDTPKNALGRKSCEKPQPKRDTVLSLIIDKLSRPKALDGASALPMLKFLASAQNAWPLVTRYIRDAPSFVTKIVDFVQSLEHGLARDEDARAHQVWAASFVTEILSMYIHNISQLGNVKEAQKLAPRLGYLVDNGVSNPSYNSSLHTNLKRNFAQRYPGCTLSSFKFIGAELDLGQDSYYDLHFAGRFLDETGFWNTKRGFAEEFARANKNLSLVEAQIGLLNAWKTLVLQLSRNLESDGPLTLAVSKTVHKCLEANLASSLPVSIFEPIVQTRLDLALVLMQRLNSTKADDENLASVLPKAWDLILASVQDFEVVFTGKAATYNRSLLKLLLTCLSYQTYSDSSKHIDKTRRTSASHLRSDQVPLHASIQCEIVTKVVAQGFRGLCNQIHENTANVLPADFALVTAILQTMLRVRGIHYIYSDLTLRLCDSNVSRYALSLFSWSDRFVAKASSGNELSQGDPVFGVLSISFLNEMSNIPLMAEFLATEGILSQLNAAAVTDEIRQGVSALEPGPAAARLHSIWAHGILPLVLNILVAVGVSFATEASAFINGFPQQLEKAATIFDFSAAAKTPGTRSKPAAIGITSTHAAEIGALSLITAALDRFWDDPAAAAAASGATGGTMPQLNWNKAKVKEDLEGLVGRGVSRVRLRERIVPTNTKEMEMARSRPKGTRSDQTGQEEEKCENRLEEAIFLELDGALRCLGGNA